MAVEKNPNEGKDKDNIINLDLEKEKRSDNVNFEVDPETGEIDIEFTAEEMEEELEEQSDFYENLADLMEEEDLQDIASIVIDKYEADKSSRAEWESIL